MTPGNAKARGAAGQAQSEQQTSAHAATTGQAAQARSVSSLADAIFAARFRVRQYTCVLTAAAGNQWTIEWEPRVPRRLSAGALRQYRRGRDDALREFAADRGINIAVVDL